ncbi:MAG TPA: tetratricopeptide repeat protein [Opitutaceae bacterium]|nr:tetratricopeptide repeat protein [Opitutaceae bacterium]
MYLLQAGIAFVVVWRLLERMVAHPWVRCVGIALGTLAFWDGVFLWGGPLAYSLAASCLTWATYLAIREAVEARARHSTAITLLVAFAIVCHPFAVPFALLLCGLRFLFMPARRWPTMLLAAGVAVAAYVIVRDSPPSEASAVHTLGLLFGVRPGDMADRITGLFTQDALFARTLFGRVTLPGEIFFVLMAVLHLAGFLISPYVALRARGETALRMVAVLNTGVGLLYLFARDVPMAPIPEWPQRILTLYSPITYVAGFTGIVYVLRRVMRGTREGKDRGRRWGWAIPPAILAGMVLVEVPILRVGSAIGTNLAKLRDEIVASGATNAVVVIGGLDDVHPFYLRCVPFLLFSDPVMISRHLLVSTEWHFQARHPSRITELSIDLGRKRYLAKFKSEHSVMSVVLVEQPNNRFPVIEHTEQNRWGNAPALALGQFRQGMELLDAGDYRDALEHFNTAIHLQPKFASAWNDGGAALYKAGQPADAAGYFAQAVKLDPEFVDARVNLATVLLDLGRPAEAIPQLQAALKQKPDNALARQLLNRATDAGHEGAPAAAAKHP